MIIVRFCIIVYDFVVLLYACVNFVCFCEYDLIMLYDSCRIMYDFQKIVYAFFEDFVWLCIRLYDVVRFWLIFKMTLYNCVQMCIILCVLYYLMIFCSIFQYCIWLSPIVLIFVFVCLIVWNNVVWFLFEFKWLCTICVRCLYDFVVLLMILYDCWFVELFYIIWYFCTILYDCVWCCMIVRDCVRLCMVVYMFVYDCVWFSTICVCAVCTIVYCFLWFWFVLTIRFYLCMNCVWLFRMVHLLYLFVVLVYCFVLNMLYDYSSILHYCVWLVMISLWFLYVFELFVYDCIY